MKMHQQKIRRTTARHGVAVVYVTVCLAVMLGFCALAVDIGRAEVAKTELHRIADAAARAATMNLYAGTTAVQNAVNDVTSNNPVDGQSLTINTTDIVIGNWNPGTRVFTSGGTPNNAVQVTARCTKANGNPIPMLFAVVLGKPSIDITASAIAARVVDQAAETQYVNANSNPWLAGQSAGTTASEPDPGWPSSSHPWKFDIAGANGGTNSSADAYGDPKNEPYGTPTLLAFTPTPGDILTISVPLDSNNLAVNDLSSPNTYANGSKGGSFNSYSDDAATDPSAPAYSGVGNPNSDSNATGSEHGIANIYTPINSMVALFLDGNDPDTEGTTPPPGVDFSNQTTRDYTSYAPQTRQPIYVGNGSTSAGTQQEIVVPSDATRMFLGTMDGHEWSNNSGGFNATITEYKIELVQ